MATLVPAECHGLIKHEVSGYEPLLPLVHGSPHGSMGRFLRIHERDPRARVDKCALHLWLVPSPTPVQNGIVAFSWVLAAPRNTRNVVYSSFRLQRFQSAGYQFA